MTYYILLLLPFPPSAPPLQCMRAYIEFEILEGAYEISCPDAMCPSQGVVTMTEIAALTPDLMMKHNRYRLNRGE